MKLLLHLLQSLLPSWPDLQKKKIIMRLFTGVNKEYIKVIFIYNTDFSLYLVTKMFFQFQNDLTSDMIDR